MLETMEPQFDVSTGTLLKRNAMQPAMVAMQREIVADRLIASWMGSLQKLVTYKKDILFLRDAFKELRGTETIKGCTSFDQFCPKFLGRTSRAVRMMLSNVRKPSTQTLGTEKQVTMCVAHLDKLVPGWTTRKGLMALSGIVERGTTLLQEPRSRFGRIVDFVTGTKAERAA